MLCVKSGTSCGRCAVSRSGLAGGHRQAHATNLDGVSDIDGYTEIRNRTRGFVRTF